MNQFLLRKAALVFCTCALLVSCKEKTPRTVELPQIPAEETSGDHQWYYITSRGLERCSLPQRAVLQLLRPWTENLRISDAATAIDGAGLLLVNRLGVLVFEKSAEPTVLQDVQLFGATTAENLVFDGAHPYFTLRQSTFFNKSALVSAARSAQEPNRPYLVRVSAENQMLYPVVTYGDLQLQSGGEVTGSHFDGENWLLSIKTTSESETEFRYLSWKPIGALDALLPVTRSGKIDLAESTEDAYRQALSEQPFTTAPQRLQLLLASLPKSFGFQLSCKAVGGASEQVFVTDVDALGKANAVLADGWVCAIFADGTSYFSGALANRQLVANGATVAFRLPKLPKNYFYTNFCVTGDYLVIGWEERDFYKTARSGVLVVDLAQVLYTKAVAVLDSGRKPEASGSAEATDGAERADGAATESTAAAPNGDSAAEGGAAPASDSAAVQGDAAAVNDARVAGGATADGAESAAVSASNGGAGASDSAE